MKFQKIKIILILLLIIAVGFFIYWFTKNNSSSITNNVVQPKKNYNIYVQNDINSQINPIVANFFSSQKQKYQNSQISNADFIISSDSQNNLENNKIGKIYEPTYTKTSYNSWSSKGSTIYLSFKKNNSFNKNFSDYLSQNLQKTDITINATGDIMLARNVGQKMISANNWNLPFLKVATLLKSGDLTISNLESPFEQGGQTIFSGMTFGADPKSISGLKFAGINLVTLANNHFGNQGKSDMTYTMDLLKQNNISYVGAGNNFNEAHSPKIVDVKGLKIATLDYDGVDSTPSSYFADSSSPGSAKMDINQVKIDIANTKKLNPDMIIINMHAGIEYKYLPNSTQTNFAHTAIDEGADMVIGNHPHSVETFENYKGKMIFYSLGNLVFDQMWSEQTKEGMILKLNLYGNSIKSFSLIPVYIIDYNQPQIATDSQAKQILSNILPDSKL